MERSQSIARTGIAIDSNTQTFSLITHIMVYIVSAKNGCTYTLDPDHNAVLYYAPLLSDGNMETAFSAYAEVEWEHLEDDVLTEADRCYHLLKGDIDCRV